MLSVSLLLVILPLALAFPSTDSKPLVARQNNYDFTQWAPPGPGDVRSPCPCLNSLANHGFLPHNGKNITYSMLLEVLPSAINVQADLTTVFFAGATVFGLVNDGQFDLDTLDEHNTIEHDGSLSRADASSGDDHTFNQNIFDTYLSFYNGMANATTAAAGQARMSRILSQKQADPEFVYGPVQQIISNGETALLLSVLGDIHNGQAPVEYIQIFFEQERFPWNEGWRPSTTPINTVNTGELITKVALASGEVLEDMWTVINGVLAKAGSL